MWVEDKPENAHCGLEMGLNPYLIAHDHNAEEKVIPRVQNWKQLYEIITG